MAREPLTQFLLIGVAIYAVYGYFGTSDNADNDRTISVTSGEIEAMADQWLKLWNRSPTDEELSTVIREHVRMTILAKEAIAMGLDDGDVVIKRRLAQKLQYLSDSLFTPEEPTEQELMEWYAANTEEFMQPDLYTISHVFFDPDIRDATALEDAEALRDQLNALDSEPESISALGDRFMLQNYYPDRTVMELSKLFGRGFVDQVVELEPGPWFGPVLSGYGVHVVRLDNHWTAPKPDFTKVQEQVRQEFLAAKARDLSDLFIDNIISRYEIVVEETDVPVTVPVAKAAL